MALVPLKLPSSLLQRRKSSLAALMPQSSPMVLFSSEEDADDPFMAARSLSELLKCQDYD